MAQLLGGICVPPNKGIQQSSGLEEGRTEAAAPPLRAPSFTDVPLAADPRCCADLTEHS
jgi:hypothetical protein